MLFNSYIFILLFLPISIIGYFAFNYFQAGRKRLWGLAFLLGMSLWFYGYFNTRYLTIMICSIIINFIYYKVIKIWTNEKRKKLLLLLAVMFNTGILFYFKYYDFFIGNINNVFKTDFALKNLLLPLGISFFTFQQLSFVIDAYRGEVEDYNFIEYALFVSFFSQLIAGPIVTHDELIPQFSDESKKKFNWNNFAQGLYIFSLGLGKKVLIADNFGNAANWGFSNIVQLDTTNAVITMLSYTIQIYFDFSGYCDMAVGMGKMLNIDLPLNFNSPYKALTILEFWKRWHITLTRFLTKYIYIPLGGNRRGTVRTYINIMLVFLVSGLWHGASWTFILWGAFHGLFSLITRHWKYFFEKLHPALNWVITFSFINMTWVLFRADTIRDAVRLINRIALFNFQPIRSEIIQCFNITELTFILNHLPKVNLLNIYPNICLLLFFFTAFFLVMGSKNAYEKMQEFKPGWKNAAAGAILLAWCIFSFSGVSTFLYFNF